jgi:hypothetical protein
MTEQYMLRKRPKKVDMAETLVKDEIFKFNGGIYPVEIQTTIDYIDMEIDDSEQELFKRRDDQRAGDIILQQSFKHGN